MVATAPNGLDGCEPLTHTHDHIRRLSDTTAQQALRAVRLDWAQIDRHACAALCWLDDQPAAAAVVGLIGGASSGKSTLFNTVVQAEVSRISAHAHETLGPIAAVHAGRSADLRQWMQCGLLGSHDPVAPDGGDPSTGRPDTIVLHTHDHAELADVVLCDLPDVTSKSSADEGAITRNLLPFFDGLIAVVDEERWFDAAVFDDVLALARAFAPRCWVVFNRTEGGDPLDDAARQTLADVAQGHQADGFHLCAYQSGNGYRPVADATRAQLIAWMTAVKRGPRRAAVADYLRQRAGAVVAQNVTRTERYAELVRAVDAELARVARDASLTLDLLTPDERALLGMGHRFVPLYDLLRQTGRRLGALTGRRAAADVEFDKRADALVDVLGNNLRLRFDRATARIDEHVAASGYLDADDWNPQWTPPAIDTREWAERVRAHIDAWKRESKQQARTGDMAAVSIGAPLLLADLLFLGGAGLTATWAGAWIAGFLGGKGLARAVQQSPAYAAYQTTVRAYQALVGETLAEQWQKNQAAMPHRHLKMHDPILTALMACATPGRSSWDSQ
jgi:hypothetical protein